jgi:ATPase subunit of ABC transporter with duplicated ATPase domains
LCWARRLSRRDFDVFRLGTAIAARHYSYDALEPSGSTYARSLIDTPRLSPRDQEDRMRTPRGTLAASNVTKSYGADLVLDGVSVVVPPRARIGVVGANGTGKTTLLRVLAGIELPDTGSIERRPASLSVGYLPQEGAVRIGDLPEWQLRKAAADMGLEVDLTRPPEHLSGGELARAKLATVLAGDYDVLLLDEPTNDLDFAGLEVLERFVGETSSALVIVSHDRAFLEHSVEQVVEFEAETRKVKAYVGTWDEYERLRAVARRREEASYADYTAERDRFTALLRERRGQARAEGKLANRRGTHAVMSKVRAAERRLERLERVEKPWQPWRLRLELDSGARAGDVVARLAAAMVERDGFRLGPIDLELRHGDRLAVLGPNGSGKTTLLQVILGEVEVSRGRVEVGPGVRFGELEQRRSRFAGGERLLETFCAESGLPQGEARALLAKFGLLADAVVRRARSLSPGERTRAGIALLSAQRVTALVLDEPTNHLDLEAIEELETALEGYAGTVLLVTHDRRLLERFEPTQTIAL